MGTQAGGQWLWGRVGGSGLSGCQDNLLSCDSSESGNDYHLKKKKNSRHIFLFHSEFNY